MEQFFTKLKKLYDEMDKEYKEAADKHKFKCESCKDNCCKTFFFHHTYIEAYYFIEKLKRLKSKEYQSVVLKAKQNIQKNQKESYSCPVFVDEKCILYEARPLICRLHGIPYKFTNFVSNETKKGQGCLFFSKTAIHTNEIFLDRTKIYHDLMKLEVAFRKEKNFTKKIKMTITDFILSDQI